MNNSEILDKIKVHVEHCLIGWFKGKVITGRWATNQDMIDWITKLRELSGLGEKELSF